MKTILAHLQQPPQPLPELRPDVPERLWRVVARLLAKEPAQRYQKPMEVVQALTPFVKAGAKPGAKPNAKSGPAPAAGPPEKGTMIRADTNKVKRILREVPGKADTRGALSEDEKRLLRAKTLAAPAGAAQAPLLGNEAAADAESDSLDANKADVVEARPRSNGRIHRLMRRAGCLLGVTTVVVLLLGLFGLWMGGAFEVVTKDGTIVLENVPDDARVVVDGEVVMLRDRDGKAITIRVAAGRKHQLQVTKEGFKVFGEEVEIDAGERRPIRVSLQAEPTTAKAQPTSTERRRIPSSDPVEQPVNQSPTPPPQPQDSSPAEDKSFVSLFNGKDLTGWVVNGGSSWQVVKGVIEGTRWRNSGWIGLMTTRTFADFHLRMETTTAEGNGRCWIQFRKDLTRGYMVNIEGTTPSPKDHTGDLGAFAEGKNVAAINFRARADPIIALKPDEWFTLEIIAKGAKLTVLINGKAVATFEDQQHKSGVINLAPIGDSKVRFRKIEIKKLPTPMSDSSTQESGAPNKNAESDALARGTFWKGKLSRRWNGGGPFTEDATMEVLERRDERFKATMTIGNYITRKVEGSIRKTGGALVVFIPANMIVETQSPGAPGMVIYDHKGTLTNDLVELRFEGQNSITKANIEGVFKLNLSKR